MLAVLALGMGLQAPGCGSDRDFGGPSDNAAGSGPEEGGAGGSASGGGASGGSGGGGKPGGGGKTGDGGTSGDGGSVSVGGRASDGGSSSDGGTSGDGGTGGTGSPPAPLGTSCDEGSECASGECVDGVCCETSCAGVCEMCNAEGRCVAVESDTACPAVTCSPKNNECLSYGAALEGGTCRSRGICKTSDDCPTTTRAANTACTIPGSSLGICDGDGECVLPVVTCGGGCEIGSNVCCYSKSNSTVGMSCQSSCPETALADNPATTPVRCDDHADCRTGFLCSVMIATSGSNIECRNGSVTTYLGANYDGQYQDNYEVCASPSMSQRTCSNGRACNVTQVNFPGWKFCAH